MEITPEKSHRIRGEPGVPNKFLVNEINSEMESPPIVNWKETSAGITNSQEAAEFKFDDRTSLIFYDDPSGEGSGRYWELGTKPTAPGLAKVRDYIQRLGGDPSELRIYWPPEAKYGVYDFQENQWTGEYFTEGDDARNRLRQILEEDPYSDLKVFPFKEDRRPDFSNGIKITT